MSVDTGSTPSVVTHESSSRTDPTKLTTDQLTREIGALKELISVSIEHAHEDVVTLREYQSEVPSKIAACVNNLRELLEAKLSEIAVATKLLQASTDRTPAQVDEKIRALESVHNEKFSSIQNQFKERDVRADQTSKQDKVAIDAALQAQKESVGEQNKSSALAISKSEASTDKRIDQLGTLMLSADKSVNDKFSDMKDRISMIENRGTAVENRGTGIKEGWGYLVGLVGLMVAFAGVSVAIFMAIHKY